jgi:hypothetical protein
MNSAYQPWGSVMKFKTESQYYQIICFNLLTRSVQLEFSLEILYFLEKLKLQFEICALFTGKVQITQNLGFVPEDLLPDLQDLWYTGQSL